MITLDNLKQEPVFFFTSVPIAPSGQGSSMRVYTNLRAYLDLGFRVELIHIVDEKDKDRLVNLPDGEINYHQVRRDPQIYNVLVKNLVMRLGFPKSALLNSMFPDRRLVIDQVKSRYATHPTALFHFEYDNFASASVAFPGIRAVWSNHDLFSERVQLVWDSRDLQRKPNSKNASRQVRLRRVRQMEDLLACHCRLILNIAEHEHVEFKQARGYRNAVLFPMSWPDEEPVARKRAWQQDGVLRLLHLGSVNGLVGYESLNYLLGEVFPLLPSQVLDHLEFWVAGALPDALLSNRIVEMAKPFPQVRFLGFVDDLREIYAQVDLQVVGGQKATGLRTRIIESMVYGVPVLSTAGMAKGLHQLRNGENILLAGDAQDYAGKLSDLVSSSPDFDQLARAARETYDRFYSRPVAAEILSTALQQFL